MSDLRSAPIPPVGEGDRVRGQAAAPLVVVYSDFECPRCALAAARLAGRPLRICFRHFPMRSKHPRAWPAACAVEAAGAQGRFWELHDVLFARQGRLEDPDLWRHARELGLDVERFEADRRAETTAARVRAQFEAGVRGGIVTAPTLISGTRLLPGVPDTALLAELQGG